MAPVHELSHVRRTSLESRFRFFLTRVPSHSRGPLAVCALHVESPRHLWSCVFMHIWRSSQGSSREMALFTGRAMRRRRFFPFAPSPSSVQNHRQRTLAHTKLASANRLETTRTRLFHNLLTVNTELATPCESFANTTCAHDSCAQDR